MLLKYRRNLNQMCLKDFIIILSNSCLIKYAVTFGQKHSKTWQEIDNNFDPSAMKSCIKAIGIEHELFQITVIADCLDIPRLELTMAYYQTECV